MGKKKGDEKKAKSLSPFSRTREAIKKDDRRARLRITLERCPHEDGWVVPDGEGHGDEVDVKDPSVHAVRIRTKYCDVSIRENRDGHLQICNLGRPLTMDVPHRQFTLEGAGPEDTPMTPDRRKFLEEFAYWAHQNGGIPEIDWDREDEDNRVDALLDRFETRGKEEKS